MLLLQLSYSSTNIMYWGKMGRARQIGCFLQVTKCKPFHTGSHLCSWWGKVVTRLCAGCKDWVGLQKLLGTVHPEATHGWGPPQTMCPAFPCPWMRSRDWFSLMESELSVVRCFHIICLKENWLPLMSALPLVGALAASTMTKMTENNMEGTWVFGII